MDEWITLRQASEILGIKPDGVLHRTRKGWLTFKKEGRKPLIYVLRDEVEQTRDDPKRLLPKPDWLSSAEVAAILGVHQASVGNYANKGLIPCERWGGNGMLRFRREDVNRYQEGLLVRQDPDWISTEEACTLLGISRRALLTRSERGYLVSKVVQTGGDNRWRAMFLRAEVEETAKTPPQFKPRPQRPFLYSPTEKEIAYLAGIVDGEGCIRIHWRPKSELARYHQWGAVVSVTNTSEALLDWIKEHFGGFLQRKTIREDNRKPIGEWKATNTQALHILPLIEPLLIVKRRQAQIVIEFQSRVAASRSAALAVSEEELAYRKTLHAEISVLNQRGKDPVKAKPGPKPRQAPHPPADT